MAGPQGNQPIPFTGAALPYRESYFVTTAAALGAATADVSPTGNAVKSYGFLRAQRILMTSAGGSGGNISADGPWNAISQILVSQPNGEELYGSNTFSGYHAFMACKHSGWKLNNDPSTWPSFSATAASPQFDLVIPHEINPQFGLGSLPNMDFSAPWKLQVTSAASTTLWQTAPTTAPTLQFRYFIDAWTVPGATNPLTGAPQQQQPVYLGALSKWTLQTYVIPTSTAFEVTFNRRGNAYRNLVFLLRGAANARVATSNYPAPMTVRWDGTVVRTNDFQQLWVDDQYMVRGGAAAATPVTADTGVIALGMAALTGIDAQASATGLGMEQFWGTVQSSTISLSGTWGASGTLLEQLTNDVQVVDLTGNPYIFAGGVFLQAPAQVSARP